MPLTTSPNDDAPPPPAAAAAAAVMDPTNAQTNKAGVMMASKDTGVMSMAPEAPQKDNNTGTGVMALPDEEEEEEEEEEEGHPARGENNSGAGTSLMMLASLFHQLSVAVGVWGKKRNMLVAETYIPHWKLGDAFRELLQNLIDQTTTLAAKVPFKLDKEKVNLTAVKHELPSDKHNFKWSITHDGKEHVLGTLDYNPNANTLTLKNRGSMRPENLLFGGTTKPQGEKVDLEIIGTHGEGLKLAILVLLRAGKRVLVRTGNEFWTFKLEKDSEFNNRSCMIFQRKVTSTDVDETIIEIEDVSAADYDDIIRCFLDLRRAIDEERKQDSLFEVKSNDPKLPGSFIFGLIGLLYVKDILVMTTKHTWTFVLNSLVLHRDRSSIAEETQRWKLSSKMILQVLNRLDELKKKFAENPRALEYLNQFPKQVFNLLQVHDAAVWYFHDEVKPIKHLVQPALRLLEAEFVKYYKDDKIKHGFTDLHVAHAKFFPIRSDHLLDQREKVKAKKLEALYMPISVNWQTFETLKFSESFRTVEEFEEELQRSTLDPYEPKPDEETAIAAALERVRLLNSSISRDQIRFHNAPMQIQFKKDNVLHLSRQALDPEITAKYLNLSGPGATGSVCISKIIAELIDAKTPTVAVVHALAKS